MADDTAAPISPIDELGDERSPESLARSGIDTCGECGRRKVAKQDCWQCAEDENRGWEGTLTSGRRRVNHLPL